MGLLTYTEPIDQVKEKKNKMKKICSLLSQVSHSPQLQITCLTSKRK